MDKVGVDQCGLVGVVHACGVVGILPDDIPGESGMAVGVPDVGAEGPVDDDVVRDRAEVAFSQFDTSCEAEVVGYDVIAGTVIQVDVPAVVTAEAVISEGDGLLAFPFGHVGVLADPLLGYFTVGVPEAVPAPAVERAVVAGFEDGIEHVVTLDEVASEGAVADIDAGSGAFVDGAVADCYGVGDGDIDAGGLFFDAARCDDQAIFDQAGSGVVVGFGAGGFIDGVEGLCLVVFEEWGSEAVGAADEADGARAGILEVVPEDLDVSVISIDEDPVTAELIEGAILDGTGFGVTEVAGA
ncbi:MAG: hypothetical protein RI897_3323 [Verrucomicrobiota bacterium]